MCVLPLNAAMLFDTTLRRELARNFGATLVVILTIVLTIMLMGAVRQAASGSVAPQDIVLLMGFTALGHLATILALTLFIAVVATLGRMYRDSEMTVWFASGTPLSRFVRPVTRMAWPVLLIIVLLMVFVWPWSNRQIAELRDRYQQRSDISRVAPGVFQTSRDGTGVLFVERNVDVKSGQAQARNVFILTQRETKEAVVSAKGGRIEARADGRWLVLEDGQRNEIDSRDGGHVVASFDVLESLASENAVRRAQDIAPRLRDTVELLGDPTARSQGELAWRVGLALGACNLLVLAIGLSARNPRRPSNWNMLFALLAFVVYYNLISLSRAWVGAGRFQAGPMMLALHGLAFVLAIGMVWWRDRAHTLLRWSWRRTPTRPAG